MIQKTRHEKIKDIILKGSKEERYYLFQKEPMYFAIYYFSEFFTFPMAKFHKEIYNDYKILFKGDVNQVMHRAFRESAKTSLAKIMIVHAICYKTKRYINWDSFDKKNAEQALFDIAYWLQTNKMIISDYGHLYNEAKDHDKKTKKRVSDFITTNEIRVEAHSTQESVRGRIFGEIRPDMFVFDDFETNTTKDSIAKTEQVIGHIDEAIAGMSPTASILYLCNYITESGSVAHIWNKLIDNPRAIARDIPLVENPIYEGRRVIGGDITWDKKYCFTDKEALETGKVSIEGKQREIDNFEAEMMNNPSRSDSLLFDRDMVEAQLLKCTDPKRIQGELWLWQDMMKHGERYGIGGDVASGLGLDASTTAIWNFTKGELIGTYVCNTIAPDVFAHEIKRQGDMFGGCIVAPENNNTMGGSTVTALKMIYENVYRHIRRELVIDKVTTVLGWSTTAKSKPNMFYEFKSAFENGEVTIHDRRVLEEMKYYSLVDMENYKSATKLATRHYDLLTAVVIGWQMRNHAGVSEQIDEMYDRLEEQRLRNSFNQHDVF